MPPLTLEGATLGQRQHHFNKLVNDAVAQKVPFHEIKIDEKSDIDQLYKIDIANKNRIADYILETLKSDDMLHVSRARAEQSAWLITDPEYSRVVNPQYLNNILFPQMTAKASSKMMLHVRLHLKDEYRVEQFYNYYESKDLPKIALKWLPNCSLKLIIEVVAKKPQEIDKNLFKRLCERSIKVLELFVEINKCYLNRDYTAAVAFLMNTDTEKYLNIVEKLFEFNLRFQFGPKYTMLILKKCPERIIEKFHKYAFSIDAASLGRYLGKEKSQEFILKHIKNCTVKSWFTPGNLDKLLRQIPKEEKYALIKKVFIDKALALETSNYQSSGATQYMQSSIVLFSSQSSSQRQRPSSNKNIYQWYKYAPFGIAFTELKKLIRAESSPDERIAMMSVMLVAAGSNAQNVEAVLQYYHDRHINEPFKFKVQFVEHLLAATYTHRYEEKCWKLLNELFHSMEVYIETGNRVTKCINSIIFYKVLHQESIPDVIGKKLELRHFNDKSHTKKLNQHEKELMFKYLYSYVEHKLNEHLINNQEDYNNAINLVDEFFILLCNWNKELYDYPVLLQRVKHIISYKKEKSWTIQPTDLVHIKRSWRKHLFEESLLLWPSEDACLNALKYDPDLFKLYASEIDALRYDDNVSLMKLQSKLRVYFPQSLGREWVHAYRGRLQQPGGHNAVVRALCTLLPLEELLPIIKTYAPNSHKISWSEADELELSLQKSIAKKMHMARPQPPPDAVLLYAKGDYLQFALPSLHAVFYNLSALRCREYLPQLLQAPVSVQKHGIRIACSKMSFQETKKILTEAWTSTKNSSIRTVIFQINHDLLCSEKSPEKAEELWLLLEMFISNLSQEENKSIYTLMGNVSSVPINIRPKYLVKCYTFLKSLPAKYECESLLEKLACSTVNIMDKIDPTFVKELILEHIEQFYVQGKCQKRFYNSYNDVIASYLIWGQTEEAQIQRYKDVFVPIMTYAFNHWKELHQEQFIVRNAFNDCISTLFQMYTSNALKEEIKVPVKLFRYILNKMEESITLTKNYKILRIWQLKVAFVQYSAEARSVIDFTKCIATDKDVEHVLCEHQTNEKWHELCKKLIPDFGAKCINYLKEDVAISPVIHQPFAESLAEMLNTISFNKQLCNALYAVFLANEEFMFGYLVVLNLIPNSFYDKGDKHSSIENLRRIRDHPSIAVQMQYDMKFYDNPKYMLHN